MTDTHSPTETNLARIKRQAYPGEGERRGMIVPDPPWTPRAMRDDVRTLIAEVDLLRAAEQDKAKQLPPLLEEIERLRQEAERYDSAVASRDLEIERLRRDLKRARDIIVDAQNFIRPSSVWRDMDLMERNIEKFIAEVKP